MLMHLAFYAQLCSYESIFNTKLLNHCMNNEISFANVQLADLLHFYKKQKKKHFQIIVINNCRLCRADKVRAFKPDNIILLNMIIS